MMFALAFRVARDEFTATVSILGQPVLILFVCL